MMERVKITEKETTLVDALKISSAMQKTLKGREMFHDIEVEATELTNGNVLVEFFKLMKD